MLCESTLKATASRVSKPMNTGITCLIAPCEYSSAARRSASACAFTKSAASVLRGCVRDRADVLAQARFHGGDHVGPLACALLPQDVRGRVPRHRLPRAAIAPLGMLWSEDPHRAP